MSRGSANSDKKGLGTNVPHDLGKEDNEYDAYRKRMMLAYRFRPNPLVRDVDINFLFHFELPFFRGYFNQIN